MAAGALDRGGEDWVPLSYALVPLLPIGLILLAAGAAAKSRTTRREGRAVQGRSDAM